MKKSSALTEKPKATRKSVKAKAATPGSAFVATTHEQRALEEILKEQKIRAWDVLLFGDGSGSDRSHAAGWACVSIEKATMERLVWYGAVNRGTVNVAEVMAYLLPLDYLAGREEDSLRRGHKLRRTWKVCILTDSEYARSTGNSRVKVLDKNEGLWRCFDAFPGHGFLLKWYWIPRESCALNGYCDKLSRLARLALAQYNVQQGVIGPGGPPQTIYDVNPARGHVG